MLPDIALEALRYFDRTTLEGLQLHSRYLRDFVNRHARSHPLRKIRSVTVSAYNLSLIVSVKCRSFFSHQFTHNARFRT